MIEDPKELLRSARKWVEDLRSGKFKQGSGTWYGNGKFCCLGVCGSQFADLASTKANLKMSGTGFHVGESDKQFTEMMPIFLRSGYRWMNLIPTDVWKQEINYGYREDTICTGLLSILNDNGVVFDKIAWILEETLIPHLELKVNELHEDC